MKDDIKKSIIAFAIGSDLSLAIFDGLAIEIKRALPTNNQ